MLIKEVKYIEYWLENSEKDTLTKAAELIDRLANKTGIMFPVQDVATGEAVCFDEVAYGLKQILEFNGKPLEEIK